jgi:membrane protein
VTTQQDTRNDRLNDRPVGDLVKQAAEQSAALVRQEIRLAQLELQEKGKRAGVGAGMFGGAGLVALYGGGALIAGAIMVLATAFDDAWIAAFIVAAALFLVAGILALTGKKQIDEATPLAPERAQASVKRDVDEVKARSGKS